MYEVVTERRESKGLLGEDSTHPIGLIKEAPRKNLPEAISLVEPWILAGPASDIVIKIDRRRYSEGVCRLYKDGLIDRMQLEEADHAVSI